MIRLIGTNVYARQVAIEAPPGYGLAPPGYGWHRGRICQGPDATSVTTVCLGEGDKGDWFREMVKKKNGKCFEEKDDL